MNSTIRELRTRSAQSTVSGFNPELLAGDPAISARALSMSFGREPALKHVDLDIPQGAIYALVGPNGAGKSTLIKILMNLIRPSSGSASILGTPSMRIAGAAYTHIGYVSENQELPDWMTVTQLLRYLRPFYPEWDTELETQLVRRLDLPLTRKLSHLSRGQRMKAALLSVIPYRPSLIVLDEPFSGLDPLVRDELIESLLDRAAEDANPPTILISSHDLAEVETLASHVGYLDRGHLLFSEDISVLISRFQEVTVTMDAAVMAPSTAVPAGRAGPIAASLRTVTYPASWLVPEISASVVRLIHTHADTEPVDEQIMAHFPEATDIQLEAMSLRSIFFALARSTRPTAAEIWSQV